MKTINNIMEKLTELKAWSIAESDPFGQSDADMQINAINATLEACGVKWCYILDDAGHWIATTK